MNQANAKQFLRNTALSQRQKIPPVQKQLKDDAVVKNLMSQPLWGGQQTVHCYLPIKSQHEVETKKCIEGFINSGHEVWASYLPKNKTNDGFCRLSNDTRYTIGRYSIPLPEEDAEKTCYPTVVIVPCVAVDRRGNRLGYGSGWYDTFLSQHQEALRIGLVHNQFVYDSIPYNNNDQQLDMIVTEKRIINCERNI